MFRFRIKVERVIDESYRKERTRENTLRNSIKRKAFKAFVGFFAIILLLTVIARAADSMTVAKVKTTKVASSELTYSAFGTGYIVAGSKKYIYLDSGIHVEKILDKEGETVKVNDKLLKINIEDTEESLKTAKSELKKLELAYEEKQLATDEKVDTSLLDSSKTEVEYAKLDLDSAKEKYKEDKDNYKEAIVKKGEDALDTKTDDYEKAKYDYDQEKLTYDDEIKKADRTIEDAQKKLDDSKESLANLEQYINSYSDYVIIPNYSMRDEAFKKICIISYGGTEEYEIYLEDLSDAQNQKSIADRAYDGSKKEWNASCDEAYAKMQQEKATLDAIKKSDYPTEAEYNVAYSKQEAIYKVAKSEYDKVYNSLSTVTADASANVSTTSANLSKVKRKTDSIENILGEYVAAKRKGDATLIKAKLEEAEKTILGESKYNTLTLQIADDGKSLDREKEDYELQKRKLDMSLANTKEIMDKAKEVLDTVKNGTYDYEAELESYKQAMDTALDNVESCKRALEKAMLGVASSNNALNNSYKNTENQETLNALAIEEARIDLDMKKDEIAELEAIIKSDGIIRTQTEGIVEKIDVEEGKVTSSDNPVVTLSLGGFSFEGTMPREEANKIAVDDSCVIRLTGSKNSIDTTVEYIESIIDETKGELIKVTATLPEGDYVVGTNGEFSVEKSSELFDTCIPLSSIREDNHGKFVLVVSEKESILGKETVTRRVEVTVVDKDSRNAVIDSSLSTDDLIIDESSKDIMDGDRVRVMK